MGIIYVAAINRLETVYETIFKIFDLKIIMQSMYE